MRLESYAAGRWVQGTGRPVTLANAVTGDPVAEIDSTGSDFAACSSTPAPSVARHCAAHLPPARIA